MSLTVDGVWKAGVWASTVWANGVWSEGTAVVDEVKVAGGTGRGKTTAQRKRRLVKVEEYESPALVIAKIEAKYKEAVKKKAGKPKVKALSPKIPHMEAPNQWLEYFRVMAANIASQREQQQIYNLIAMARIKINQEVKRLQDEQNEDEEMFLILMVA